MTPRAAERRPAGGWDPADAADVVALDYDGRYRRRRMLVARAGLSFLMDLPAAVELRQGDGLRLDDGRVVLVEAADEPVTDLIVDDAPALVRLAWHLGNRHLPTQIFGDRLRIRRDHVIEEMAEGLGARVSRLDAPFEPEGGAYGGGRTHSHD